MDNGHTALKRVKEERQSIQLKITITSDSDRDSHRKVPLKLTIWTILLDPLAFVYLVDTLTDEI